MRKRVTLAFITLLCILPIHCFGQYQYDVSEFDSLDHIRTNDGSGNTEYQEHFGMAFNNDGTKLFFIGREDPFHTDTPEIWEYTLSIPYDLSTATYAGQSEDLSISGEETRPMGLDFNNDGSKLFVIGNGDDSVVQYTLDSPFDVSTASYDGLSEELNFSNITTSTDEMTFNNDGTKLFIAGRSAEIFEFSLGTAYDISTASFVGQVLRIRDFERIIQDIEFNKDGTSFYVLGYDQKAVIEYTLANPFDLSTASNAGSDEQLDISGLNTIARNLAFNGNGKKLYLAAAPDVFEYKNSKIPPLAGLGRALEFTGNKYVDLGSSQIIGGDQSFTIELWLRPTDISEVSLYGEFVSGETDTRNYLKINSDGEIVFDQWRPSGATISAGPINANQWTHVAYVRDGSSQRMYINGQQVESNTDAEIYSGNTPDEIAIGRRLGTKEGDNFEGAMDELRIWSVPRTASEIKNNMKTGIDETNSDLLAYYNFNGLPGTTILKDRTGNNNYGLLTNMDFNSDWVNSKNILVYNIAENESNGSLVASAFGFNNEGDDLNFNITSGNSGNVFTIDSNNGDITVNNDSNLDFETKSSYALTVQVSDGNANDSYTVQVDLTDINEPPVTADNHLHKTQNELVTVATSDISFIDEDSGDTMAEIQVTALPNVGTLFVDANDNQKLDTGETLNTNDLVSKADLDANKLYWSLPSDTTGYRVDSFNFKVSDGTLQSSDATMQLTLDKTVLELPGDGEAGDGSDQWHLLSQATDGLLSGLLNNIWTRGNLGGTDSDNGNPNVYTYIEEVGTYAGVNLNINRPGKGYAVYVLDDDDNDGNGDGFPKHLPSTGSPNRGPINFEVSGSDLADNTHERWNLIGNPYGTAISVDSVFTALEAALGKGEVNTHFYIWDPAANAFTTLKADLNTPGTEKIAPYQGFFIRLMNSTPPTNVTFTEDIRTSGSPTFFKETVGEEDQQRIVLNLSGKGLESDIKVHFHEEAEVGVDIHDSFRLKPLISHFIDLFSLHEDEHINKFVLPTDLSDSVQLPLRVASTDSGSFELRGRVQNLPADVEAEVVDLQTDEVMSLSEKAEASMNVELEVTEDRQNKSAQSQANNVALPLDSDNESEGQKRFELRISPNTAIDVKDPVGELPREIMLNQNFPNPFNPATTIRFTLPESQRISLVVYNMMGQQVAELLSNEVQSAGSHSVRFDAGGLSSGVYFYRLQSGSGKSITRKLTLMK